MNISPLLNKIQTEIHKLSNIYKLRPNSYPFLSGDMFRSMSDFVIETKIDLYRLEKIILEGLHSLQTIHILFVAVSFIENNVNQNIFKQLLHKYINYFKEVNLIIHNGDKTPELFLRDISNYFSHVYAVNVIEETDKVSSIPIGIKNIHYDSGLQQKNITGIRLRGEVNYDKKKNILYVAFNVHTNWPIRKKILSQVQRSKYSKVAKIVSQKKYLEEMAKSMFCLSPPGNGHDCHRTWEAIYLKTIPVILNGHLANSLTKNLPIIVVDDYSLFLSKPESSLKKLYQDSIAMSEQIAYSDYWIERVRAIMR